MTHFDSIGYDRILVDSISGVINFLEVVSDDESLTSSPKSLAKLKKLKLMICQRLFLVVEKLGKS